MLLNLLEKITTYCKVLYVSYGKTEHRVDERQTRPFCIFFNNDFAKILLHLSNLSFRVWI